MKDFFSKRNHNRSFLRIWSHLLKKSVMENFICLRIENKHLGIYKHHSKDFSKDDTFLNM